MNYQQIEPDVKLSCAELEPYLLEGNPDLPLHLAYKNRDLFRRIDADSIDIIVGDSNPLNLSEIQRWILIVILLSHPKSNCLWLHYRGMLIARKLEFPGHRMWEVFHAYSVISRLEDGKSAAPKSFGVLAECNVSISPRNAAQHLYSALKEGASPSDLSPAIRKLTASLDPNDQEWVWNDRDSDNESIVRCIDRIRDAYPHLFTELNLEKLQSSQLQDQTEAFRVKRDIPQLATDLPLDEYAYRYLRRLADKQSPLPSLSVRIIENAYISIERFNQHSVCFYVFDSQRRFIPSLSSGVLPFIDDNYCRIDGDCLFISDKYSHSVNICHYIYDELMRLLACEHALSLDSSGNIDKYTIMTIPTNAWSKQCLEWMRPDNKVISQAAIGRYSYRVKKLCVSSDSSKSHIHPCGLLGSEFDRQKLNQLKSEIGAGGRSGHCILASFRRILITRDDVATRRFVDQDKIVNVFRRFGFEAICIDAMSFTEQRELFATAEAVAAVHGQALANMIFMPSGALVLEFLPSRFGTHAYGVVALSLGHNYHWHASISTNAADDIKVDLGLLEAKLDSLFSK